jgi:group I intron endonuclease
MNISHLNPATKKERNCVYCAYNRLTKKCYIGYTQSTLYRRILSHYNKSRNNITNNHFHNALLKYDKSDFEWYVLYINDNIDELKASESDYIKKFNSNNRDFGYNSSTGGENVTFNEDICEKISSKAKSRNLVGKNNPFYGKHHSDETRKRWSEIRKGKCNNLGYKHSNEIKQKMKIAQNKSRTNPNVLLNMSLAQKGKKAIMCIESGQQYNSIGEAARTLNIPKAGIKNVLHNRAKSTKGYTFKFIN